MNMTTTDIHQVPNSTHAIILAAGLGSRLKENTKETPKCLVPVSGQPILRRMLQHFEPLGIRRLTLVVGYLDESIRHFVADWQAQSQRDLEVDFVLNDRYGTSGSGFSLLLALLAADAQRELRDVLLIEGDVVLERALLKRLLAADGADAATLLAPYVPELSGTFATVSDGFVSAWLHETARGPGFALKGSFKTVNLTLVRRGQPRTRLLAAVSSVMDQRGVNAPLEYAMQELVAGGMHIAAIETAGQPWFEVDTPEDLKVANAMFPPLAVPA